jgi:hypothetical protein
VLSEKLTTFFSEVGRELEMAKKAFTVDTDVKVLSLMKTPF